MLLDIIKTDFGGQQYVHENVGTYLRPTKTTQDGVITSGVAVYEEVNNAEVNSKYKSSDYDLANILDLKAYGMLTPTYVSTMSDMDFVDSFQNIKLEENV